MIIRNINKYGGATSQNSLFQNNGYIHLIDITVRVKCSLCIDSRFDFDVEKGLLHHIRVKHHLKELTEEFKAECIKATRIQNVNNVRSFLIDKYCTQVFFNLFRPYDSSRGGDEIKFSGRGGKLPLKREGVDQTKGRASSKKWG